VRRANRGLRPQPPHPFDDMPIQDMALLRWRQEGLRGPFSLDEKQQLIEWQEAQDEEALLRRWLQGQD